MLLPTIAGIAAAVATLILTLRVPIPAAVIVRESVPVPVPIATPRLVLVPVPALATPRTALRVDGRIERVAASASADVIAFATKDRVWVSRDGGASFSPLAARRGELAELFVDDDGTVFAQQDGRLVIAAAHAPAWDLALPPFDGRLLAVQGTDVLAVVWEQGVMSLGVPAGSWMVRVAGHDYSALAATSRGPGEALLAISERVGEHRWSAPALHVLRGGVDHVVWTGRYDDSVGYLRGSTPCAGLVGDTLWIVQRDPNPDLDQPARPAQLLAVGVDGRARGVSIDADLDAARVTCSIAGNARAAYASVSIDGHASRLFALGSSATPLPGDELELRAVDAGGHALGLRGGDLVRRADDGALAILARGR